MAEIASKSRVERWPRRDLPVALGALVLAIVLDLGIRTVSTSTTWVDLSLAGYLAFWVPLLAACALVRSRGWDGPNPPLWSVRPLDILWGLGVGLLIRAAASFAELAARGGVAPPVIWGLVSPDPLTVVSMLLAGLIVPIVVAPTVEELFFRGLLLGSLVRSGGGPFAAALAVVVSSVLFALPHAAASLTIADGATKFLAAGAVGLAAGTLTVITGRIGAAIFAHIAFNGSLYLLLFR